MRFREVQPHGEALYRYHSDNDKVELAITPVIYGYRIAAYPVGSQYKTTDWCAGGELHLVARALQLAEGVLSMLPESDWEHSIAPRSMIKPIWNDPKFMDYLLGAQGDEVPLRDISELPQRKQDYLLKFTRYAAIS